MNNETKIKKAFDLFGMGSCRHVGSFLIESDALNEVSKLSGKLLRVY